MLALAACDPATTHDALESAEALNFTCTGFAEASEAALIAAYGAENIVQQALPGAEGESYTASVLYPDDPQRRVEIVWSDETTRVRPASVSVSGEESL